MGIKTRGTPSPLDLLESSGYSGNYILATRGSILHNGIVTACQCSLFELVISCLPFVLVGIVFQYLQDEEPRKLLREIKAKLKGLDLSRGWAAGLSSAALAIAGLIFSGQIVFSWQIELAIYFLCFMVIFVCGYVARRHWENYYKLGLMLTFVVYWALFGAGTVQQYRKDEAINLVFRDSPVLTPWKKMVIAYDLAEVKKYLKTLDIPVPERIPTIAAQKGNGETCEQQTNVLNAPLFQSTFTIDELCLGDRPFVTQLYIGYALASIPPNPHHQIPWPPTPTSMEVLAKYLVTQSAFSAYLNWSFWGRKQCFPATYNPFADILWQMQARLGQDFMDSVVAYAALSNADNPLAAYNSAGTDPNITLYFARALRTGALVKDDGSKWPVMLDILRKENVPVDKL